MEPIPRTGKVFALWIEWLDNDVIIGYLHSGQ